jgi:hypothetical protein
MKPLLPNRRSWVQTSAPPEFIFIFKNYARHCSMFKTWNLASYCFVEFFFIFSCLLPNQAIYDTGITVLVLIQHRWNIADHNTVLKTKIWHLYGCIVPTTILQSSVSVGDALINIEENECRVCKLCQHTSTEQHLRAALTCSSWSWASMARSIGPAFPSCQASGVYAQSSTITLNIGLFSWNIALIPEAPKFGLLAIYLEYTWSICHLVNMLPLRPLSFFCGE